MKKLFATLLFNLLLLNFAGVFLYFPVELYRIHQEMKARLKDMPDEKLEILSLGSQEYQKAIVEEEEIQFNDKMYDIARIKMQGDRVLIFALADKAEDDLLAFLDEIVSGPLKEKKMPPAQILQFITLAFLQPNQNTPMFCTSSVEEAYTAYLVSEFSCLHSIESPPPRG